LFGPLPHAGVAGEEGGALNRDEYRARDRYAEVGAAMRLAIGRATAATLSDGKRRVFEAVLSCVASFSRLDDLVYVADVAQVAHVSERHTRDCLASLRDLGIIVWEPKRGQSVRSRLGLPKAEPDEFRFHDDPAEAAEHRKPEPEAALTGTATPDNRNAWSSDDRVPETTRELLTEERLTYDHAVGEGTRGRTRDDDEALAAAVARRRNGGSLADRMTRAEAAQAARLFDVPVEPKRPEHA
jgi:hypothetical protein